MKSLLSFFLLCGLSLNSLAQDAEIRFTIENAPSDSCVIAYYCFDASNYCYLASENEGELELQVGSLNRKGQVSFKIPETQKGLYRLQFLPIENYGNRYIEFLLDGNSFNMSFDYSDGGRISLKSDSKANQLRDQEIAQRKMFEYSMNQVRLAYSNGWSSYFDEGTDIERFEDSIVRANEYFYSKLFKDYPTNLAVQMIKAEEEPDYPQELINTNEYDDYDFLHCFDNVDFSQSWVSTMPSIGSKIGIYFQGLVFLESNYSHPDSIIVAWDKIIASTSGNKEMFSLLVTYGYNWCYKMLSLRPSLKPVFFHFVDTYYLSGKAFWVDDEVLDQLKDVMDLYRNEEVGK